MTVHALKGKLAQAINTKDSIDIVHGRHLACTDSRSKRSKDKAEGYQVQTRWIQCEFTCQYDMHVANY